MPNLLDAIDSALDNADLASLVTGPAASLGSVQGAVEALVQGPDVLGQLAGLLQNPPQPPGLSGLDALGGGFGQIGALIPSDLSGPLAPMLAPLNAIGDAAVGGTTALSQVLAGIALGRQVFALIGREVAGGTRRVARPRALLQGQGFDLAQIRRSFQDAEAAFDAFESRLDAAKLLEVLQRLAPGWTDNFQKWPPLPVISEVLDVLGTSTRWASQSPDVLSQSLVTTLEHTAELVLLPRIRVADPLIACASVAAQAPSLLAAAHSGLASELPRLAAKLSAGERIARSELAQVVSHVEAVESLARALAAPAWASSDQLPEQLERWMISVVRALHSSYDPAQLEERVTALIARIPAASDDPLAPAHAALEQLDLSFLTGPLGEVQQAVEDGVSSARDALGSVEQGLTDLLAPVADALDQLLAAARIADIQAALQQLPAAIDEFLDAEVRPRIQQLQAAVEAAIDAVSGAVDAFDPSVIKAQLEAAIRGVAELLQTDALQQPLAEVRSALEQAVGALENLDLSAAADESIQLIGDIEQTLADIDPSVIPDEAKPLLNQAVTVVRDVDFTNDVAAPLLDGLADALAEGPALLLRELDALLTPLRQRLEAFRPSQVILPELQQPFEQLISLLDGFEPSALLRQLDAELGRLAEAIHVVDPEVVLGPLEQLHGSLRSEVEKLSPERLLAPVQAAISGAIDRVLASSGLDGALAGLDDFVQVIRDGLELLDGMRGSLTRIADKLANPGSLDSSLDALVASSVARLSTVDLARLAPAFELSAEAVRRVERGRIAADLAAPLGRAAAVVPDALRSEALRALAALASSFPVPAAQSGESTREKRELAGAVERLGRACQQLSAASDPWHARAAGLAASAAGLHARLSDYERLTRIDGQNVFADLQTAPASHAALQDAVRGALEEGLRLPLGVLHGLYAALAPHVGGLANSLSRLIEALHSKLDALLGDGGVAGIAGSIEEAADLLRNLDLSPLTTPLRVLYERITAPLELLSPAPLRAALETVREALDGLLQVAAFMDEATINQLDSTYQTAVDKLRQLSPQSVLGEPLDAVYGELLADVLPAFDIAGQLRTLVDRAAPALLDEIKEELGRVEVAFDRMLDAIPLDGGGSAAAVGGSIAAVA